MQPLTSTIDLPSGKVTVRELTIAEIRAWVASVSNPTDLVDAELFDELQVRDLLLLTDLTADAVEGLTPSQIDAVIAKAKEANARFFVLRQKMVVMGQRLLEQQTPSAP